MAILQQITVKETPAEQHIYEVRRFNQAAHKMLLAIIGGIRSAQELVMKTKANRNSISNWKNAYQQKGIEGLLEYER